MLTTFEASICSPSQLPAKSLQYLCIEGGLMGGDLVGSSDLVAGRNYYVAGY
jgi:hypothetical protein